jgi:nitroimidazol reductase NimA-like FMN-containing flavoprotein (pyridoxamine 5'-phosphate oxidase superfamily)
MTTHETADTEVLTTNQCWELLRNSVVGRLAVTVDGSPDIFPVNPVVDHGTIVFRTTAGTKLAATKGRDVAFEVDGYDPGTAQAWSVVVKGGAHEIWEVDEILRALRLPLYPWQPGRKPRFVRVEPHSVTGRRFVVEGGFRSREPAHDASNDASNERRGHATNA